MKIIQHWLKIPPRPHTQMEIYSYLLDWKNQYHYNSVFPTAMHRLNTNPIKMPMLFFIESEKVILSLIWNQERPRICKVFWTKKKRRELGLVLWFLGSVSPGTTPLCPCCDGRNVAQNGIKRDFSLIP